MYQDALLFAIINDDLSSVHSFKIFMLYKYFRFLPIQCNAEFTTILGGLLQNFSARYEPDAHETTTNQQASSFSLTET